MSTTARTILILVFAAAGVGAALAIAAIDPAASDSTAASVQSGSAKAETLTATPDSALETPANPAVTQPIPAAVAPAGVTHSASHDALIAPLVDIIKTYASRADGASSQSQTPSAAHVAARQPQGTATDEEPEEIQGGGRGPNTSATVDSKSAVAKTNLPEPPTRISSEGDGRITLHCRGSDIREVLELISQQAGLNIIPAKSVTGQVTASLPNVGLDEALDVIVKSAGFQWRREGKFIHVGSREDFKAMDQASDHMATRVYRPNYVTAKELETLITPMLTPSIGRVKASTPAKTGVATDDAAAGGDDFAGAETVVVHDYEKVLAVIDQLISEMDCRPTQVAIEAMILSVKLDDQHRFGVDFEFLRNNSHMRLATGSPLNTLGEISFDDGGLKFGYLDTNLAMFLDAVETIGDANIVATPRVLCLNRQRAEIHIGEQLGYVDTTQTETASTQSVKFLDVGTFLRIRPYISQDGTIRLEVHPELSTGNVRVEAGLTLPDKNVTKVTSNVMVRDGSTVVIGGLIRDEMTTSTTQVPFFGSLPVIGAAFRRSTEDKERREVIVLITPHIVYEPEIGIQGDKAAREFHHRHMIYADKMSPLGKRHLGRRYFHKAQQAWHQGDQQRALWLVNLSIHFDPLSRAAIDLRSDITSNNDQGDHTDVHPPRLAPNLHPLDGELLAPWIVDELGRPPMPLQHPIDRGVRGETRPLSAPEGAR